MKSKISAMMDGELKSEDVSSIITQIKETGDLKNEWSTYHLIGDSLRRSSSSIDIARRVSTALATEPTLLAPRTTKQNKFKVFALSVAASLAAVAMVGWMGLQSMGHSPENFTNNKIALQPEPSPAIPASSSIANPAPAPAQINDYLLAHRQFSATPAMYGVAPYLRTSVESRGSPDR
ncbi:MAG: sigma-E factor negative regulatory protein [Nitrosomonadaceae bacterium]|nr:sigma-E factor negative regulatory protein [Nitrosospira sp.]MDW7565362.1 sigma-E factor negative regulatory protein [Nitrosomonadaceae bacterium]MBI0410485.1 sigma-E factor negative regulatory protein [Nitrosospira sp.]MBI0412178.1 sigma-E factor negative regulatory protein [Nitrosospira sp.]MDW7597919.1 sigma-E factor negative regulatory protein [Nitrosomonadaceae bacterium]